MMVILLRDDDDGANLGFDNQVVKMPAWRRAVPARPALA
jgi:hypothetical protein